MEPRARLVQLRRVGHVEGLDAVVISEPLNRAEPELLTFGKALL